MILRVGMPEVSGRLPLAACEGELPVLVSAGRLWDKKRGAFRVPSYPVDDLDVALDSGGFVAATMHGGYRWTVAEYVELTGRYSWAWCAQMDLCCEPEVAADPKVRSHRILRTQHYLIEHLAQLARWRDEGAFWLPDPMPVLQGWTADDYERSAYLADDALGGAWPSLVGIGSVCRRQMHGEAGILAILDAADRMLPAGVKLHLFGVKGAALAALAEHPRVGSADSMAWDFRARRDAHDRGVSYDTAFRCAWMKQWAANNAPSTQLALPLE